MYIYRFTARERKKSFPRFSPSLGRPDDSRLLLLLRRVRRDKFGIGHGLIQLDTA